MSLDGESITNKNTDCSDGYVDERVRATQVSLKDESMDGTIRDEFHVQEEEDDDDDEISEASSLYVFNWSNVGLRFHAQLHKTHVGEGLGMFAERVEEHEMPVLLNWKPNSLIGRWIVDAARTSSMCIQARDLADWSFDPKSILGGCLTKIIWRSGNRIGQSPGSYRTQAYGITASGDPLFIVTEKGKCCTVKSSTSKEYRELFKRTWGC